jgi:mono/diheme cytochrome c family protein
MKRLFPLALGALATMIFGLSGCQDADFYSSLVKYGVRTDPLVVATQPSELGDDVFDPDRPGVLPVLKPQDVLMPENPMHAKGPELFKQGRLRDPMQIPAAERQQLDQVLTALFGTPGEPKVGEINAEVRDKLKLDEEALKEGSRLYRIHCVHCHGVPGDGRGPTGRWINPHPRDFRQGLFKFMSVDQTRGATDLPPRRQDLYRTLRGGIEGTAMPSFILLRDEDLNHLVSYVIHLSMRGRAEFDTIRQSYKYDSQKGALTLDLAEDEKDLAEAVRGWHTRNVAKWMASQTQKIQVADYDEHFNKKDPKNRNGGEWKIWKDLKSADKWLIRGAIAQALFNNEEPRRPGTLKTEGELKPEEVVLKAKEILAARGDKPDKVNCKQCHIDYGRQAKFKFDAWGTLVRPNNFTVGIFRGGRRPADIYHRIHSGINGSGMTPFGDPNTMSTNSIWDMAEFVQALSYPAMRSRLGITID